MSKLYKSGQCVEADPCRLQPADVEAFFIKDGFTGETGKDPSVGDDDSSDTTGSVDTDAGQRAFGEAATSGEEAASANADEAGEIDTMEADVANPENGAPKTQLEKLFDVAGHIRSLLEAGHQEMNPGFEKTDFQSERDFSAKAGGKTATLQGATSDFEGSPSEISPSEMSPTKMAGPEVKKGVPQPFSPPKYQTGKLSSADAEALAEVDVEKEAEAARERAKLIFAGAQREAGELTDKARNQAESLLGQAQLQMKQRLDGAEQQVGSILSGAQQQAGQITSGASSQAQSMLQDAEAQAESIVGSAKGKVLLLIENAKKEADTITGAAEQEAAELKAAAKKEAEDELRAAMEESIQLKNQATQEGLATGRSEGAAQIREELEQNLSTALAIVNQAEEERLKRIGSSEPELLKLAVGIAEKIIGAELKLDPTTQLEIAREALTRVATANNIIIRVNSEDYKQFMEHSAVLQKAFTEPKMIRIEEDPGVTPGNSFIETEHGNIDPRIKSQLEVIWAELLRAGTIS